MNTKTIARSAISSTLAAALSLIILFNNMMVLQKAHDSFTEFWLKETIEYIFTPSSSWLKDLEHEFLWNVIDVEFVLFDSLKAINKKEHELVTNLHHSFLNAWEREQVKLIATPRSWHKKLKKEILWMALDAEHAIFRKIVG